MTLEIITADDLLPVRHGFFTRRGGVSTGIYAGLNCGPGSNDDAGKVAENRRLVADSFGLGADRLATLHQVHSADVLIVGDTPIAPRPKCDAMVTDRTGIVLGILTADCQPVLFSDAKAGVIGAAHAGWKGALAGVLEATIDAMERLGARRNRIRAAIGPAISGAAYEVGPEFRDIFTDGDARNARFFSPARGDRLMFDLPAFGVSRLRKTGIASATWSGHCTYRDAARFYSYRRATHARESDYGRLISAITL